MGERQTVRVNEETLSGGVANAGGVTRIINAVR
jgi:hypothetical protein